MVAPPGPVSTTSAAALSKLNLKKTPAGIAVFMIKFPSALGPLLASTLRSAMRGTLDKHDPRAANLLELIYDCLIGCMPDDKDVVKMTKDCGMDGHLCLNWLKRKYAPTNTASSIKALLSIFQEPLGDDIVAGIDEKIAANDELPDEVTIGDEVLAVLILAKLPENLSTLVNIIVERDEMPSCDEIREKVFNQISIQDTKNKTIHTALNFTPNSGGFCFNCDTKGHLRRNCTKPKADCSECGKGAGHPDKYCLVIHSDKPIPEALNVERKVTIVAMRARRAQRLKAASSASASLKASTVQLCAECSEVPETDDNFWEHLAHLNTLGLSP